MYHLPLPEPNRNSCAVCLRPVTYNPTGNLTTGWEHNEAVPGIGHLAVALVPEDVLLRGTFAATVIANAWELPVSTEELREIVLAVLTHAHVIHEDQNQIYAAVQVQLHDFEQRG